MATVFHVYNLNLSTTFQTIYTVPSLTTTVVLSLQIANVSSTQSDLISCQWLDSSNSNKVTRICGNNTSLPTATAIGILTGKLVLESGDSIQLVSGVGADISEATISVMEMS